MVVVKKLVWLLVPLLWHYLRRHSKRRQRIIPPTRERVLILGASSGIGQAIAHAYAARGASVCITGRRAARLESVRRECAELSPPGGNTDGAAAAAERVLALSEDFAEIEGLLRVRDLLTKEWGGLDTLVVAAGVSTLRPLLSIAGVDRVALHTHTTDTQGLSSVRDVAAAAMRGNFTGPLLSAVAFIPLLTQTSQSPSILLVSSVAATIPPPTRTLYAASKAASLLLFQALSIEHPEIHFTNVLPFTVEGEFRASAIDGGPVVENSAMWLKRDYVARACVHAIDTGQRTVWLPWIFRFAPLLYWMFPSFIDEAACRKYNFKS